MNRKIPMLVAFTVLAVIVVMLGVIIFLSSRDKFLPIPGNNTAGIPKKNVPVAQDKENKNDSPASALKENAAYGNPRLSGNGCHEAGSNGFKLRKDFNLDEANAKISYADESHGISFKIPYNSKWGNKDCQVKKYYESGFDDANKPSVLFFGKPSAWGPDEYRMQFVSKRSAEEVIAEQKNVGGEPDPNPRIETIGGKQVVVYESYGMSDVRVYEIIGKKFNYVFDSFIDISNVSKSMTDEIRNIISSVKFI